MANNSQEQKPNQSGNNFFLFFLLFISLFFLMQGLIPKDYGKVHFNFQAEHLVNLDLVDPTFSKKVAQSNELVTFSGRFSHEKSAIGQVKYQYLFLVDEGHGLTNQLQETEDSLNEERQKILDASSWYYRLLGNNDNVSWTLVDSFSNTSSILGPVIFKGDTAVSQINLIRLRSELQNLNANSSPKALNVYCSQLLDAVKGLQSPILGIGDESLKTILKDLVTNLEGATLLEPGELYQTLQSSIATLSPFYTLMDNLQDYPIPPLRSVRNFDSYASQYLETVELIQNNDLQIDRIRDSVEREVWYFNNEILSTDQLETQDSAHFHQWFLQGKNEWDTFDANKGKAFEAPDQPLNLVLERTFKSEEPPPNYFGMLFTLAPIFLVLFFLYLLFSRQVKGVGGSAMSFGKSPARLMNKDENKVTFDDVAGIDEAKEELQEIVDFLKDPHKFTALGGHIPKGVLCIGSPGTGKTLIAKAVAGEADRPFFSISGSDFVEMFVGVGASRIRDMFTQAKKSAPCIIFMDEIDAVGRHRGAGVGGGHDEREQTLNQLLVEMDGFDSSEGVILMAATNRPDVLDKALLRPGRFDRQIIIPLPDIKGRLEILKVHAKKIVMDKSVDLNRIARGTPGCSGADLANILNESALIAAKKGKKSVEVDDTVEARDKVLYGKERRSQEIKESDKRSTAYHESGHAVVGAVVEHGDPVEKVTIIPRGMSLGSTMFLPEGNRVSYWKNEVLDRLAIGMGGRCAEEIFIGDICSGARGDIEQATQLARAMVCEWGMTELGLVAYDQASESGQYLSGNQFHDRLYSESTAQKIDEMTRNLIDEAHKRATKILEDNKEKVELMTDLLMEFETIYADDVKKIMDETYKTVEDKRLELEEELSRQGVTPPPPEDKEEDLPDDNEDKIINPEQPPLKEPV